MTRALSSVRLWQIDALRGLMLVLMTLTHLPTRVASLAGQPLGFVSAAEGFVLLSGFMAGMVYAAREQREGGPRMRAAFYRRVAKIYLCQAALLLFLFTVVALIAAVLRQEALAGLLQYYLEEPLHALLGGLLLIYSPPLLDILPLYVLFMLLSPMLLHGQRHGWSGILVFSVVLWLGAQFKLGSWLYEVLAPRAGIRVPLEQTGAFDVLAWQFLWVLGLWLGVARSAGERQPAFPRWMLVLAWAVATLCFVWRHAVGQTPFPWDPRLNILFDKWQLAPLRLLDLFALLVLALHYAPWLSAKLPRLRWLEMLGTASLPVFCAHLVLALLALGLFGAPQPGWPLWLDAAILAVSFAVLFAVARLSQALDRQSAARKLARESRFSAGLRSPSIPPPR